MLFEGGAGLEPVDNTLDARDEGAVEEVLLPAADFTLSSALFCIVSAFPDIHVMLRIP